MKTYKQELLIALILYLLAGIVGIFRSYIDIQDIYPVITTPIFIASYVLWADSVRRRFVQGEVRLLAYAQAIMMISWIVIRFIRYTFVDSESFASRFLWYMYYIPFIMLPVIVFFSFVYIGRMGRSPLSKRSFLVFVPVSAVALGILTNDLHQEAFVFTSGFENASKIYEYGLLYYISFGIIVAATVSMVVLIFVRFIREGRVVYIWIPVCIALVALFYNMNYHTHDADKLLLQKMYEMPEFMCLFMVLFWESAVYGISGVNRQLALNLEPQLSQLQQYLDQTPDDESDFELHMKKAAVLNVYIKRRANLLLLAGDHRFIRAEELELAFAESLEYLKLLGVPEHMEFDVSGCIRADAMIFLYELFENALESAIKDNISNAVFLVFKKTEDKLSLYIEIGAYTELLKKDYMKNAIKKFSGTLNISEDDGTEFITYQMPENAVWSDKEDDHNEDSARRSLILDAKKSIHDDAGQALLALRTYLMEVSTVDTDKENTQIITEDYRDKLLDIWRDEVSMFRNVSAVSDAKDPMDAMKKAASAIGVELVVDGDLPTDDRYRRLIAQATHECITNTVRHAKGNTLYITSVREDRSIVTEFTNDGERPRSRIWETGGLRTLRQTCESIGADMSIEWEPRFVLKIKTKL